MATNGKVIVSVGCKTIGIEMKKILTVSLLLLSGIASACYPPVNGIVTAIKDGDTFTFKPNGKPEITIRLAEIDAPEKSKTTEEWQDYGVESRDILSALVLNKQVTVESHAIDIAGRTLATVSYQEINVNKYMIKKGAAWAYTQYMIDPMMMTLQKKATLKGSGLWALPGPVEPWIWRQTH